MTAARGLYLAGGEDKAVAHQVCFIREHLRQFLAHFSGQFPQPQQVVVDGHPRDGLGGQGQRTGNEMWRPLPPLLSSLQCYWGLLPTQCLLWTVCVGGHPEWTTIPCGLCSLCPCAFLCIQDESRAGWVLVGESESPAAWSLLTCTVYTHSVL